jgi:hypothetical protein
MRPGAAPAGPGALAFRRLRRDRWALAWGGLFLLLVVAFLAAPLYADVVAGTGPSDNHLTDQITIAGEPEYVSRWRASRSAPPGTPSTCSAPTRTGAI